MYAPMTRILIADDHPLFRAALTQALRELVPGASLVEAGSLDAVHTWLEANPDTDLVLLDLHMPGSHGLAGLASVRCRHPAVAVAMISGATVTSSPPPACWCDACAMPDSRCICRRCSAPTVPTPTRSRDGPS